ncbi:MAG: hypothetical protein WAL22_06685 [Solirubrobacteraceae bacterium]
MHIMRNIKEIRIDWLKVVEAFSAASPWGPMIAPDGTIYSPDGRVLATPAAASTPMAAARPAHPQPQPAVGVHINDRTALAL